MAKIARTQQINFRVTKEEREALTKLSNEQGIKLSSFIRNKVMDL